MAGAVVVDYSGTGIGAREDWGTGSAIPGTVMLQEANKMHQRSRAHWVRGLGLLNRESSLDSISMSSSPSAPMFEPMADDEGTEATAQCFLA